MIRILLTYILPLLVPTVIYFLWLRFSGGGAQQRETPWAWLIGAGIFLAAVVLAGLALLGGTPEGVYEPAHMEDGKLVPGRFRPVP